jgi:hypothetical protein
MNWITRGRPKTDRIACPWLITKFIDHDATIVFVAPDQVLDVAAQLGGHSFDAPGATYTHRADHCTFEVLIDEYVLGDDPALALLAIIVHAADIEGELDSHPVGAGLLAIDVEADDHVLVQRGAFVYDALYAWCQREVARH